ncbi:MAG: Na+/H+ antiporter, partial [uncultured Blastococcus sp.]
ACRDGGPPGPRRGRRHRRGAVGRRAHRAPRGGAADPPRHRLRGPARPRHHAGPRADPDRGAAAAALQRGAGLLADRHPPEPAVGDQPVGAARPGHGAGHRRRLPLLRRRRDAGRRHRPGRGGRAARPGRRPRRRPEGGPAPAADHPDPGRGPAQRRHRADDPRRRDRRGPGRRVLDPVRRRPVPDRGRRRRGRGGGGRQRCPAAAPAAQRSAVVQRHLPRHAVHGLPAGRGAASDRGPADQAGGDQSV